MATKQQQLEKQLEEIKKAQEALLGKIDDCMRLPDVEKKKMWDAVAPFLKTAIMNKINNGQLDMRELQQVVFEKAVKAMCGEDALENIDRL